MGNKKRPVYLDWYQDYVVDDTDDIWDIANVAAMSLKQKMKITVDPKLAIAIFCNCFESYIEFLKTKQAEYPEYCINIMDTLEIGYSTTDNDEDEKNGNFMFYVYHIPTYQSIETDNSLEKSDEICVLWANSNLFVDTQSVVREMNSFAKKYLHDNLNIQIENAAVTLMIFLTVYESVVKTIQLKRAESKNPNYFITLAGILTVNCVENTEGEDNIFFKVEPSIKVNGKNDTQATGIHES